MNIERCNSTTVHLSKAELIAAMQAKWPEEFLVRCMTISNTTVELVPPHTIKIVCTEHVGPGELAQRRLSQPKTDA